MVLSRKLFIVLVYGFLLGEYQSPYAQYVAHQNRSACDLIVDAGPDTSLCAPGGQITLMGSVTGNTVSTRWTPTTGLSNPAILTPVATITGTITYTLQAVGFDPTNPNLVVNGDFESGNTGFTSDYTYLPDVPGFQELDEGEYSIVTNPFDVHNGFFPCEDHTTGDGNMAVYNGGASYVDVWCQTITVQPNTLYQVSAWVASVHPLSPAILIFYINSAPVGPIVNAPSNSCEWASFDALWNSGNNTTAVLCIQNKNLDVQGNDFAIDDISMVALCTVEDEVTITVDNAPPTPQLSGGGPLCEGQTTIINTPQMAGVTYLWSVTNEAAIISGQGTNEILVGWAGAGVAQVCLDVTNGCGTVESCIPITMLPAYEVFFDTVLCAGSTMVINGTTYGNGLWNGVETFTSVDGCDSIVNVAITESPITTMMVTASLCEGDSIFLAGAFQTAEGIYTDIFTNAFGCDSTIITEVVFGAADTTFVSSVTCDPSETGITISTYDTGICDSVVILTVTFSASDTTILIIPTCFYADTGTTSTLLTDAAGCDSLVIETNVYAGSDTMYMSGTTCSSADSGIVIQQLTNQLGCDSIIVSDLQWLQVDTTFLSFASCLPGDTGVVTLSLIDMIGCDSIVVITTALLPPDDCQFVSTLILQPVLCFGDTAWITIAIHAGLAPFELNWESGASSGSQTFASTGEFAIPFIDEGDIYFQLTAADGLLIFDTIELDIPEPLFASAITTTDYAGYNVPCYGDAVGVIDLQVGSPGTPPLLFQWSNGHTAEDLTTLAAGLYEVTITDLNGCTDTAAAFITQPMPLQFEIVTSDVGCAGNTTGSVAMANGSGGALPWSTSLDGNQFVPDVSYQLLAPGVHDLVIRDQNNCLDTATFVINEVGTWSISLGPDATVPSGTSFSIMTVLHGVPNGDMSIKWSDGACADCLTRTVTVVGTTTYQITATDESGCVSMDEITLTVTVSDALYIPTIFSPNGDGINDEFFITADASIEEIESLSIYDRWGSLVFEKEHVLPNDPASGWNGTMQDKPVNPGVFTYALSIRFKDGDQERRGGDLTLVR